MIGQVNKGNKDVYNCFLPACYMMRNVVELSLKMLWFEEIHENYQIKCKILKKRKHNINEMWKEIKTHLDINGSTDDEEYLLAIGNYCLQLQTFDSDSSKFRYPVNKSLQPYFNQDRKFDFVHMLSFMEAIVNAINSIDMMISYQNELEAELLAEYASEMESYADY